ncbi:MAG: hypothetical protein ACD_28C00388G0003 [uncultured bacterium]|nr:MAG: hypothetical protein ACD_28C00388G0003 [uncultured bacterium]KKT76636.1 MAG: hypothetical protein UW70_C0016G0016 [Candidatus Peregrinibacteria bacterium GW2011_GWA2_44_7]
MQFKIPQNVQMEDKIVGPITLKQLIILGVGGGIDYFLYISLAKVYVLTVWMIPVAIIGLLTLAIAFLKIQGIPFANYVLLSIEFYFKPQKRLWIAGGGDIFLSITQPSPKTKAELAQDKQQKNAPKDLSNISELSKILNTHTEMLNEKHETLENISKSSAL